MAKKKESLSFEERLEKALVPVGEQPYKVPSNWVWVHLGAVLSEIRNGTTIKQDKSRTGYYVTRIESIQQNTIDFSRVGTIVNKCEIKDCNWYKSGDIALSHINSIEHVGKTAMVTEDMLPLVHGMNLLRLRFNQLFVPKLFQLFSQSFQYKQSVIEHINMAVNQVSINQQQLKTIEIPLPPLAEQQRIIDRIESLFSKLDEAKEKAQTALDSFENRKAAILHKAFTGELSKKWREKNGISLDSWEVNVLGAYANTKYGYTESANVDQVGPKFLRITDIQDGFVDWCNVPYCSISSDDYDKYKLHIGDIVVARTGATTGKSYMIIDNIETVFASYLIRLNIFNKQQLSEKYLYKFMQSSLYWNQITELSQGIAQPGVNASKLKTLNIPVPKFTEQTEIVRILDNIFEKEQKAKELANVIDKIDLIKKAILARAFRGELGTNDPSEESAVELLKECLK